MVDRLTMGKNIKSAMNKLIFYHREKEYSLYASLNGYVSKIYWTIREYQSDKIHYDSMHEALTDFCKCTGLSVADSSIIRDKIDNCLAFKEGGCIAHYKEGDIELKIVPISYERFVYEVLIPINGEVCTYTYTNSVDAVTDFLLFTSRNEV